MVRTADPTKVIVVAKAHPRVLILGFSEAGMLLNRSQSDVAAAIAIQGFREPAIDVSRIARRLMLRFDDVDVVDRSDPLAIARMQLRQRFAGGSDEILQPPTPQDAQAIIEFAQSLGELNGTLLCQCHGGISRSSAAALLCLATWTPPGNEAYCVEYVRSARSGAAPHPDVVAFGDELLGRKGRLNEALQEASM
jgi:predicted protein tyrosine phosphatase